MNPGLLPVYSDSLMDIEQAVLHDAKRSFDDFTSGTCIHGTNSAWPRKLVVNSPDFFYIFPKHTDINHEHYMFGQICLLGHTSLFVDRNNQPADKWNIVDRFPGLWNFFSSQSFQETTLSSPVVFWHVPRNKHDEVLSLIKHSFALLVSQQNFHNWNHDIHSQLIASWDEDDWPMAFRLSTATSRSLEHCYQNVINRYVAGLTIDNIDIAVYRRRLLRTAITQELMQNTLIAKLMIGMELINDSRANITKITIVNQLTEHFDALLTQAIKQHLGK